MATFEVKVYKLKIEEHPDADSLELAVVGDYRSVVRKGAFATGDLGVYIPEGAIVPDWLIEKMGLTGMLAGKNKNRVKAVKLRGVLSQGIVLALDVYPFHTYVDKVGYDARGMRLGVSRPETDGPVEGTSTVKFAPEGTDVAEFLGITKYEPPIPTQMAGEVFDAFGYTLKYDIENYKRYPDVLREGEEVTMTEKLHGSWTCLGYHHDVGSIVTSKGLSSTGLAFKLNEANENNLYVRTYRNLADRIAIDEIDKYMYMPAPVFYILGETFGPGVQDLAYGLSEKAFRVFDVYVGETGKGKYLNDEELENFCKTLNLDRVPVLYRGPFSKEKMLELTDGNETVSGTEACIREGVIITPVYERTDPAIGRVKLKSVSEAYLLRSNKDATEYS